MRTLVRFFQTLVVCALVEVLVPLAVTLTVPGDAGFGVTYILFFIIDPLFAVVFGAYAGRALRERWFVPLTVGAVYVLGAWCVFSFGEPAFLYYGGLYLVLGLIGMFFSALLMNWREAKKQADAEKKIRAGK